MGVTALRALLGEGGTRSLSPFLDLVFAVRSEEGGVFPGEQEVDEELMLTLTVGTPAGSG